MGKGVGPGEEYSPGPTVALRRVLLNPGKGNGVSRYVGLLVIQVGPDDDGSSAFGSWQPFNISLEF